VDQDLATWHEAGVNGSVARKRRSFDLAFVNVPGHSFALNSFRLRRGTTDIPMSQVRIFTETTGLNLNPGAYTIRSDRGTVRVVVAFEDEEIISTSGNVYTLHASVTGTVLEGESVATSFARLVHEVPIQQTTYVSLDTDGVNDAGVFYFGPLMDTGSGVRMYSPGLVSDVTETPHSPRARVQGGSRDWFSDTGTEDLTVWVAPAEPNPVSLLARRAFFKRNPAV
jgi:hypothetical protein